MRTSVQTISTDPSPAASTWLPAALIGYAVFLFAPQVLNDGDTYSHIATGDCILLHRAVPVTDPFSYTFAGAPWVAHEWLSELIMATAYRSGGWSGLLILFAGATAFAVGLLAQHLARWLAPLPATIALLISASCISPSLLARPHILVLPILVVWTLGLLVARERARVPWPMLPLMLAWANMHGSFIFGLLLVCPFALEAIAGEGTGWRCSALQWTLFLCVAVALASATPFGWRGLIFPFRLMGMKQLDMVGEWQPTDFQTLQPIEPALMAVLYVCLSRGARVPMLRLVILIDLLHLALLHTRHQMLAGVVGALILAEPLGRSLGALPADTQTPRQRDILPLTCFLVLTASVGALRVLYPAERTDGSGSPITAVDYVSPELAATPVLNSYEFGGYLIFRGVRPFIDGRADMYGDGFLLDYAAMMRPDRALLIRTLDERGIRWTVLNAGSPAVNVMDTLPGWRRLYADRVAAIHVRTQPHMWP
jgi:hypothetical protein